MGDVQYNINFWFPKVTIEKKRHFFIFFPKSIKKHQQLNQMTAVLGVQLDSI